MLMLMALIDVTLYLWVQVCVHQAVREGVRIGMAGDRYDPSQIAAHVVVVSGIARITLSEVTVDKTGTVTLGGTAYRRLRVDVRHRHKFLIPVVWTTASEIEVRSVVVSTVATALRNPG